MRRSYLVSITEVYDDGHQWTCTEPWTVFATEPHVALKEALAWNRRSGKLAGHGRMVAIKATVREA